MNHEGGAVMPNTMQNLIEQYIVEVKKIYGIHLRRIILYGSYARGDYHADSDVDIMILVDLDDLEIKSYAEKLSDITFDMNLDNDVLFMPIVKNESHFNYWLEAYPFYNNINKEGVALYAA